MEKTLIFLYWVTNCLLYSVSLRIQSECKKMQTRITPNTERLFTQWKASFGSFVETCCSFNLILMQSSIVNKVIRGNFTSTKSIKSIKGIKNIKSIKSQASYFLPLRYFMRIVIFFLLDASTHIVIFSLLDILCL